MTTKNTNDVPEVASHDLFGWRHIGELGEIAYMEDGSRRWTLKAGWEDMRLFLVYLRSGEIETHFAYIDDWGTLCDHNGDNVGWLWCDAEYFMDIPQRPSLPNANCPSVGANETKP